LTLWLDKYGYFRGQRNRRPGTQERKWLRDIQTDMDRFLRTVPLYFWYAGRAQLISRLCHPVQELSDALSQLLSRVLRRYPRRMVWSLIATLRSTDAERKRRVEQIWAEASAHSSDIKEALAQAKRLAGKLIDMALETPKDNAAKVSLSKGTLRSGAALLRAANAAGSVLLPVQTALAVQLPLDGAWYSDSHADFSPFGTASGACITGLNDSVTIFSSLQKPKKVVFSGDDGRDYGFVCKKDDDL
jgi:phosphatidylinositol kinase/protein kinase (PI-3  family)